MTASARRGGLGDRLLWACPIVGLVAAAAILWLFGLTLWTALAFVLLVACPLVVACALAADRRETQVARKLR